MVLENPLSADGKAPLAVRPPAVGEDAPSEGLESEEWYIKPGGTAARGRMLPGCPIEGEDASSVLVPAVARGSNLLGHRPSVPRMVKNSPPLLDLYAKRILPAQASTRQESEVKDS